MTYDRTNVFAKILRGEIPCAKLYEDDYAIAFADIAPSAPAHVLVIPKGEFISFDHFVRTASADMLQHFFAAVQKVAQQCCGPDYRVITNNGEAAGQSVHHFHVHLLSGKPLGPLLAE
ncbi:MAG: HIT domain-containing protein [Rickettsiales bacterium]